MIKSASQIFPLSAICVAIYIATCSTTYALEKLDEEDLAESTGEEIALLPQDFSMRFNGASDTGSGVLDTGYIRLIPVGPVSADAQADGFKKADVYLYGL